MSKPKSAPSATLKAKRAGASKAKPKSAPAEKAKPKRPGASTPKPKSPPAKPKPKSPPAKPKPKSAPASKATPAPAGKARDSAAPAAGLPGRSRGGGLGIVGIGASAGGLEALELFLRNVPERSGLAFVVVQHLDPTHQDMLVELLQRVTSMPVLQAADGLRVARDHVYVLPPNKDLSLLRGTLHLLPPVAPRGLRLPIDFFFRSLAADARWRGLGVLLSGMGSDGTLGLRAIKEQGGAVFVQSPESAKFDSMPRSAIDAGLADVVAPVEELPARIVAFLAHAPLPSVIDLAVPPSTQRALEKVCALLRAQCGHDFSQYKTNTLYRRIERRMGLHQIADVADYVRYLQENPQETTLLFKELLIGVTSFFRDPAAWEQLASTVIPDLLASHPGGGVLRAWVPGCSTGEEAYSLAIAFKEALAELGPRVGYSLQIFATDLDKDAIERARAAVYPPGIVADVSPERLRRFFVEDVHGFRVAQEIRETVIFATQNVIMDPPFTKLDLLSCRNLLIYLAPELQQKLLHLFHYALLPGGVLFLGSAETLGGCGERFAAVGGKTRIYRRLDASRRVDRTDLPLALPVRLPDLDTTGVAKPPARNLQALADRLLLERFSPASVLTNEHGDILYISGRTGPYLEPAAGKANWNVHAMAREGLRYDLGAAFEKVVRRKVARTTSRVVLDGGAGERFVDVTVEAVVEPEVLRGMVLIVFAEVALQPVVKDGARAGKHTPAARARLELELRRAREMALAVRHEMRTSQDELKSTNEELQSTNEELQSTNEELTTSKEEMQSMNEELQTLNHELQTKLDELTRSNDDMRNLLDSTEIATLFLDDGLCVRRFTARMAKIVNLIPGDVGRPITDLASTLVYPALAADAHAVLHSLVFRETTVATNDGCWYSVRIMPYRTADNRIDGVVITFVDVTAAKKLEATLRERQVGGAEGA